ncbi:MAG: carboxypeptidase-like regulatory domain-containing protein [Rudaea sp.]
MLALILLRCCTPAIAAPTSVHGRVTSHFTGQPFVGSNVEIVDAQFHPLASTATDADGVYQWSGDCPDSAGATCVAIFHRTYDAIPHDAATASFANGAQNAVVDLQPHALAYLNGSVGGLPATATDAGPILTFRYDEASSSWQPLEEGPQTTGGFLAEGHYRLCLGGMAAGTQRQCFDHRPEASSWAQQTYTDIDLAEGERRDDIDFDLLPGGSISGTLIDAAKGVPQVGVPYNGHRLGQPQVVTVDLYDADGVHFDRGEATVDEQGHYRVSGTPTGTFRVQLATSLSEFRDPLQVYPGIACASSPCPIDAGTPVDTLDHDVVSGVDVTLHPNVTIRGTITDAVTHQPIAGVTVAAWRLTVIPWSPQLQFEVYWTESDAQGNYVAYATSDWAGGIYVVAGSTTFISSIYPNVNCPNGVEYLCINLNPYPEIPGHAVGLAVNAATGDAITGIDFALQQGGAFNGLVSDVGGAPISASFDVYDALGSRVSTFSGYGYDAFGNTAPYQSPALPPGTYYATATYGFSGPCQAYSARPCPTQVQSILDVAPTPITISLGENSAGINFRIPIDRVFVDGFGG